MTFPLALELADRLCLVVGSGTEAEQRASRFLELGARVRWLSPSLAMGTATDAEHADRLERGNRAWRPSDLDDVWLVVLADRDAEQAASLSRACNERRIFFCAIDQPAFNSFNHVAVIEQGPVRIAISTGGKVPALARRLKVVLERLFGDGRLAAFASELAALRERSPAESRKQLLERALSGLEVEGRLLLPSDEPNDEV